MYYYLHRNNFYQDDSITVRKKEDYQNFAACSDDYCPGVFVDDGLVGTGKTVW